MPPPLMAPRLYIPTRISREFRFFFEDHFFSRTYDESLPLIFCLLGPPGVGKTVLLRDISRQHKVKLFPAEVWAMGGRYEGDSVSAIFNTYVRASEYTKSTGRPAALKIEDLHLSPLGQDLRQSGTTNDNRIRSFIMELCENPLRVRVPPAQQSELNRTLGEAEYVETRRVPIVTTSNSLTQIHPPIRRSGRMEIVVYNPTETELIGTIAAIWGVSEGDALAIMRHYPGQTPAFFADVRRRYSRLNRERADHLGSRVKPYMPEDSNWWDLFTEAANFLLAQRRDLDFLHDTTATSSGD